jgi:hypothetical protein
MRKAGSMRTNTKKDHTPVCVVVLQRQTETEREKFGKTGSGGRVGPQLIDSPREREQQRTERHHKSWTEAKSPFLA